MKLKIVTPHDNRCKCAGFLAKTDGSVFVEVQQENNLHFLIDEMERWRSILGKDYCKHKTGFNNGIYNPQHESPVL